MVSMTRVFVY